MGDVSTIAICIVIFILLGASYIIRDKSYRIFSSIVGLLMLAAICNIGFYELLDRTDIVVGNAYVIGTLYILRVIYHFFLFDIFFCFTLYATIVSKMEKKHARIIAISATALFIAIIGIDVALTFTKNGFIIDKETGEAFDGFNIFEVGYFLFIAFLTFLMFRVRKLLCKRILIGFFLTMILAVITRIAQMIIRESSLTTLTFTFPVLAMLYIMHVNPYNANLGTLNEDAMEDMIKNLYNKQKPFIIMSLVLPDFVGEGKDLPKYMYEQTRRFSAELFRDGTMFQIGNGQIIMIARKDRNPDYNEWFKEILDEFTVQHNIYKAPYKIVYGESFEKDLNSNEYLSLITDINSRIPNNTMKRIDESDIAHYKEQEYVKEQLDDIYHKGDLNDERVLVYCQPVYNVKTKRFDTAEALMRLKLEKTGIISPNVFIPIAEANGYIHALTKIILNKTCQVVKKLVDESYIFSRISINVSTLELKDDGFCDEFNQIIADNGIKGEKIAIELTESQNEEDFMVMKERIVTLHKEGIHFYLDDFGTGYSNIERILELPFDIIKFDRSMVIATRQDKRSNDIVKKLANVFEDFNYFVLFEGVEDNIDEDHCLDMSAAYLQGFKYSKPIPIDQLHTFMPRA